MRETREFARALEHWRPRRRPESLATVTWFEVSGPPPCAPTLQAALRETARWLVGGDTSNWNDRLVNLDLHYEPDRIDLRALLERAGGLHGRRGEVLNATLVGRPSLPALLILTVSNLAADAATLTLLVDRLGMTFARMTVGSTGGSVTEAVDREPCFRDFVTPEALESRLAALLQPLSGATWLERRHLSDSQGEAAETTALTRVGEVVLTLSAWENACLVAAQISRRATPTMLAIAAWAQLLSVLTGAGKVAALINTTARQFDGLELLSGFFYDLGIVAIKPEINVAATVAAARRAVIDHHAHYVPSGLVCPVSATYTTILADPRSLLVAVQAKTVVSKPAQFGNGERTAARSQMSHGAAFSLPLDGLMTLEAAHGRSRIIFEYGQDVIRDEVAADLAAAFKQHLIALADQQT